MPMLAKLKAWFHQAEAWLTQTYVTTNSSRVFIQLGHAAGGYGIAATALWRWGLPWWASILLLEAWAVPKEFWWDYRFEDAAIRGSSPLDYACYHAGLALALLVNQ